MSENRMRMLEARIAELEAQVRMVKDKVFREAPPPATDVIGVLKTVSRAMDESNCEDASVLREAVKRLEAAMELSKLTIERHEGGCLCARCKAALLILGKGER
jgi:hypothetical protein